MKIVINNRYGGFNVSEEFLKTYNIPYELGLCDIPYPKEKISRTDSRLIEFIEKYGSEKAFAFIANLEIREIPTGTYYRISEYDGLEYIEYRDEIKWEVAT